MQSPAPPPMNKCERVVASDRWSALPDFLLYSILCRLTSLADFSTFGAVCRSWRSVRALPPSPGSMSSQSPLLLAPLPGPRWHFPKALYDPTQKRFYKTRPELAPILRSRSPIGLSHGYLILSTNTDGGRAKILLWNPLTGHRIRLPEIYSDSHTHAILSSPPASAGCIIFIYCGWSWFFQYRRLRADSEWTVRNWRDIGEEMRSLIFFEERLYGLVGGDRSHRLAVMDLSPHIRQTFLEPETKEDGFRFQVFDTWLLAECCGNLLLVKGLDIWRWDFVKHERVKMASLDGWSLFECDFGLVTALPPTATASRGGVRSNCIYRAKAEGEIYEFVVLSFEDQSMEIISSEIDVAWSLWIFPSQCC